MVYKSVVSKIAAFKGIVADALHTTWDGDGGKAAATFEGTVADAGYAVGDGDGGQSAATRESTFADACHAVWDGDGGQAAASIVFVNRFISAICKLNGRKVTTVI